MVKKCVLLLLFFCCYFLFQADINLFCLFVKMQLLHQLSQFYVRQCSFCQSFIYCTGILNKDPENNSYLIHCSRFFWYLVCHSCSFAYIIEVLYFTLSYFIHLCLFCCYKHKKLYVIVKQIILSVSQILFHQGVTCFHIKAFYFLS